MLPRKIALVIAISASLGTGSALAAQVSSGYSFTGAGAVSNFTVLTPNGSGATGYNPNYQPGLPSTDPNSDPYLRGGPGYTFGHTNDVTFTWDGTLFNSAADYTGPGGASNATISTPKAFLGSIMLFHDVQIFGPGAYSFDSTAGGGVSESGTLIMTVGAGQIGAHMLFNWNGGNNMDVVNVWNRNSTFSTCGSSLSDPFASNCLWTGGTNPAGNNANTVFLFASTDNDGDGTLGVSVPPGGPFGYTPGFNFNFNLQGTLTAIPIPGAVWLYGSGLLGLMGMARRKKHKT
jgi:hypothetical protein